MGKKVTEFERFRAKDYASRMSSSFYCRYWCLKTIPPCFNCCCSMKAKIAKGDDKNPGKGDPTFEEIVRYYEELED